MLGKDFETKYEGVPIGILLKEAAERKFSPDDIARFNRACDARLEQAFPQTSTSVAKTSGKLLAGKLAAVITGVTAVAVTAILLITPAITGVTTAPEPPVQEAPQETAAAQTETQAAPQEASDFSAAIEFIKADGKPGSADPVGALLRLDNEEDTPRAWSILYPTGAVAAEGAPGQTEPIPAGTTPEDAPGQAEPIPQGTATEGAPGQTEPIPAGTVTEGEGLSAAFTALEAGEYELCWEVKDAAGRTAKVSRVFTVR